MVLALSFLRIAMIFKLITVRAREVVASATRALLVGSSAESVVIGFVGMVACDRKMSCILQGFVRRHA